MPSDIDHYHQRLDKHEREICEYLERIITQHLPQALGKMWHGHPVWFLGANPIVGYTTKKAGVELLFWSGQSFTQPGLKPIGKFQAAGYLCPAVSELDEQTLGQWLAEAERIQWDYAGLPKKRVLEKLTSF